MMKLRTIFAIASLACIAAALFYTGHRGTLRVQAQSAIHVTPFTVEQITVSYEKDPAGVITEQRTLSRRSDGSQAMMGSHPGWLGAPPLRRIDLLDGHTGSFADWLKGKMTGYSPAKAVAARKSYLQSPPAGCVDSSDRRLVGNARVNGLDTYQVVQTVGAGAPQGLTITEWRSPVLSCYSLQLEILHGGSTSPYLRMYTSFVQLGDPSPIMFDTSPTYTEMKPSEFRKALFTSMGVTEGACPTCFTDDLSKVDETYLHQQSPLN